MSDVQGHFDFSAHSDSVSALQAQFETFHAENPKVYKKLVELARLVKRRGFEHYSIKSLFEQVRWHFNIETNDVDFKLNNNYHSRYARLIMAQEKDLVDFFELRCLSAERKPKEVA